MNRDRIKIGITQGDTNGIGYEVILKSLADSRITELFEPIVYGSSKLASFHKRNIDIPAINLNVISSANGSGSKKINIINCVDDNGIVEFGVSTCESGLAAFSALEKATQDLKVGLIQAMVTAPINKHNIQSPSFMFPGHTEYIENTFGEKSSALMMLVSNDLRIAVVTGHIPISKVPETLTQELILKKLTILNHSLKQDFGVVGPRIAVLGLNPHAGDNGVIGNEEERIIKPAMQEAEKQGILCFGPYPSDGFFGSGNYARFDAILAMYHDQGLIPFKTLAMDSGVNFTAGLPVIRTSPDHGTAYDLAGKDVASPQSMLNALYLACDVYRNRIGYAEATANPLKSVEKRKVHKKKMVE